MTYVFCHKIKSKKPDYRKIWELEEELDLPHTVEEPATADGSLRALYTRPIVEQLDQKRQLLHFKEEQQADEDYARRVNGR